MASEGNKLSDLERLIAEEKQDKARQNEIIDGRNSKEKRKKITVISAVAATSIALIVGLIIYDPFTQSIRWESDPEPTGGYSGTTGSTTVNQADDPFSWAKETGKVFPVKTKEWEEKSYLDSIQSGSIKEKQAKYWGTDLRQAAAQLPSEANGFTADDSKSFNDDGSLNPLYSYWTQEVFYNETIDMLERIINPVYGSWGTYQYSQSMENAEEVLPTIFKEIMSPEALASGAKAIPVLADWNKDDFGMKDSLLGYGEGNRWIGEVTGIQTTFTFNEENNQYDVILVANVTYSAWTKDKNIATKEGVLTLNLGANSENKVASPNKVIINSASLELK